MIVRLQHLFFPPAGNIPSRSSSTYRFRLHGPSGVWIQKQFSYPGIPQRVSQLLNITLDLVTINAPVLPLA